MNVIHSIAKRERGLLNFYDYDVQLQHLKCVEVDQYPGVEGIYDTQDYYPNPPIFACKFSSASGYEQIIALANEVGNLALHNTNVDIEEKAPLKGTRAHYNAIFDIDWMPQELKLITVSGDRSARLWDVSNEHTQIQEFCGHTSSVKTVAFRKQDKAVFATGGRDGAVLIWDTRASHNGIPKPDNSITKAHEVPGTGQLPCKSPSRLSKTTKNSSPQISILALAFQDDYTLFSCSATDGLIKAWDLRKNYRTCKKERIPKYVMKYNGKAGIKNSFTSLNVCPTGNTLYASCIDRKIYAYNISSYEPEPVAEYYGHGSQQDYLTYFVKANLSPDGKYIISGSNDQTAYIWNTKKPGLPILALPGHNDEVTCNAWCNIGETKVIEETKIVTCSDDTYFRIWRVKPDTENNDMIATRDIHAQRYERKSITEEVKAQPEVAEENKNKVEPPPEPTRQENKNTVEPPPEPTPQENKNTVDPPLPEPTPQENKNVVEPPPQPAPQPTPLPQLESPPRGIPVLLNSPSIRPNSSIPITFSPCANSSVPTPFSPTTGLPNFVVDGTAPHLLQNSPHKSKENVDWLTKLRKRKNEDDALSPTSRTARGGSKTPKRRKLLVPAITDFYSKLGGDKIGS